MLGLLIIDFSARFPIPDVLLQKLAFFVNLGILKESACGFRCNPGKCRSGQMSLQANVIEPFAMDFWKKLANSLVCNMWKVDTRSTSASVFSQYSLPICFQRRIHQKSILFALCKVYMHLAM
jgi:hypothetical protein